MSYLTPTFDPYALDDDKTAPPEWGSAIIIGEPQYRTEICG